MSDVSLPMATTWLSATVFATVGAMKLAGIRAPRQMYERWDVPTVTHRIIGLSISLRPSFWLSRTRERGASPWLRDAIANQDFASAAGDNRPVWNIKPSRG